MHGLIIKPEAQVMVWRHRRDSETDYELIWLAVSCATFAGALLWLKLGLPWPNCPFHEITHHACLTCGATRCMQSFFSGNFLSAFFWNPLAFVSLVAILLYDFYAAVVLLARLPRLHIERLPRGAAAGLRLVVVLAAAANWIYLVRAGI